MVWERLKLGVTIATENELEIFLFWQKKANKAKTQLPLLKDFT